MKYLVLISIAMLFGCSGKTCEEMGGKVMAKAPLILWDGDKIKTVYPTECVK